MLLLTNKNLVDLTTVAEFMLRKGSLNHSLNAANNPLVNYFFSLSIIEDALKAFLSSKFRSFDALVGNNSCYIVSYIIFSIARKMESDGNLIKSTIEKIQTIQTEIKKITKDFTERLTPISIPDFLDAHSLNLILDIDCIYLAMAYACTITKEENSQNFEEINCDKLSKLYEKKLGISLPKKSVQKLVKHWQKSLSIFNVKILQSEAETASFHTNGWAHYITNEKYTLKDTRERWYTPSLYSVAFIYDQLMKMSGALIALQVNLIHAPNEYLTRFTLLYEIQANGTLQIIDPASLPPTRCIYTFTGCRYIPKEHAKPDLEAIKAEFASRDLKELVMAHEVTYPHYPKSLNAQDIEPSEEELIKEVKRLRELKGFSLEDPSDLCLFHIFIDDVLSQSLSVYEPPIYIPQLNNY